MFSYTFLPKLLNMSLTAGTAVVFVLLLRLLLRRAPRVISYALWAVVLFRLLCPVAVESGLSVFGLLDTPTVGATERTSTVEYIPADIVHTEFPKIALPVPGAGEALSSALPQGREQLAADPLEAPVAIATWVWMTGVAGMCVCSAASFVRLRRRLTAASPLRDNIFLADGITSPFVLGLFRPKIYLPSGLEERELSYIILHEQHHIRRLDHIVRALAFAALCIHWFNPLVWVAFVLSGRDMEMSCDEAVIRKLGADIRADYSASLLSLATGRRIIAGTPLAFGEGDTKSRIRNLAGWRKPALWVVIAAAAACAVLALCLLTNPKDGGGGGLPSAPEDAVSAVGGADAPEKVTVGEIIPGTAYVSWRCLYLNPLSSFGAFGGDSGLKYIIGEDYFAIMDRSGGSVVSMETSPALDTADSGLQNMTDVSKWEWQEFPYTDEEWAELYKPPGFGGIANISEYYDEMLYQPLSAGKFLLRMDGELWLVELSSNAQMGTYLWSIYSLVPESFMGVAQWEYAPMLSSRSPVFRFEFDMEHSEVSAVCTESLLVDFDSAGAPSGYGMSFRSGNALCWSPVDEDGNTVSGADIHFTVHDGDATIYAGTIYIEGSGGTDGRRVYTASLAGTGLHLSPNTETGGGVISAVSGHAAAPVSEVEPVVEYDLRTGDLEVSAGELGGFVFFTNSGQISVELKGGGDPEGIVTLRDISQQDAEVGIVKLGGGTALFTGLTSARLYRLDCHGLEGCTLVISGEATPWLGT